MGDVIKLPTPQERLLANLRALRLKVPRSVLSSMLEGICRANQPKEGAVHD